MTTTPSLKTYTQPPIETRATIDPKNISTPSPDSLDEMVRDFTSVVPRSKSEVRRRIKEHCDLCHLSGIRIGKQVIRDGVEGLVEVKTDHGWAVSKQTVINLIDDNLSNKL